jgi:ABC-type sugar transport system ATPase subunit
MVEAHVLIGNPNTRKSTLLRCLSGCFNRSVRDMETVRGDKFKLYARASALQESRTTVAAFQEEVARSRCQQVLFSLWPGAHPHDAQAWPDAIAYLEALQRAGWVIRHAAVLGAHPLRPPAQSVVTLPSVLDQPINASAAQLRQHFGWK